MLAKIKGKNIGRHVIIEIIYKEKEAHVAFLVMKERKKY